MARNPDRRLLIAGLGLTGAAALARVARALPPPRPASTGTSLQDVYDKIARTDAGFGEARIPVESLPGSATAQYVIGAPGVYYLTGNITGVAGKAALEGQSDHVEIECDGFKIFVETGTLACITVPGAQRCIGVYSTGVMGLSYPLG